MIHPRTAVYSALTIGLVLGPTLYAARRRNLALAKQPATKTTLITLGTQGGPTQNKSRSQPANVLIVNDEPYVIDAGNGVARQLTLAGVPLGRAGQIFITHNHDDHNADLGTMMGLAWTLGRSAPITVHGPKGTRDMIDGFLRFFSANKDIRRSDFPNFYKTMPEQLFKVQEIEGPGVVYKDGNVQVEAIENCHFHFPSSAASNAKSHPLPS